MMNRKLRISLIIILAILIVILGAIEIKKLVDVKPSNQTKVEATKKIGPYTVEVAQTSILQGYEDELKSAVNEGKNTPIMKALTKYFIADYFTLRYKNNMYEVGGQGVVYPKTVKRFKTNAIDSYYLDVAEYNDDYGSENLPLVDAVSVNKPVKVDKATVDFDKGIAKDIKTVYDVKAKWQYEANDVVNAVKLGIVNEAIIRFVVDNENQVWVYEILGVE